MFVVWGTYHWAPRIVAFRQDWCTVCQRETLVLGNRTIDVGHVFWIPLLPFGRWTRWRCSQCARDPGASAATRRPLRIVAWLLVSLLALSFVLATSDPVMTAPETAWFARGFAVLTIGFMTWWAFRSLGGKSYKEQRAAVTPFQGDVCPVCDGALAHSMDGSACSRCDAQHRPLPKNDEIVGPIS